MAFLHTGREQSEMKGASVPIASRRIKYLGTNVVKVHGLYSKNHRASLKQGVERDGAGRGGGSGQREAVMEAGKNSLLKSVSRSPQECQATRVSHLPTSCLAK